MSVREITGDLFALDVDAIGHGVNTRGVMGAGIAAAFAKRYPTLATDYKSLCRRDGLSLGQVYPWRTLAGFSIPWQDMGPRGPLWVYNIASQNAPGPCADLEAIEVALWYVRFHAERHALATVALPQIGAGIGGLEWEDVREVMRDVLVTSHVEFQLVTYG